MRTVSICATLVLITQFAITGCTTSSTLSRHAAIRSASREAAGVGYRLEDYKPPQAHHLTGGEQSWVVFFPMKAPTPPGGVIQVLVDDHTGKARIIRTD